MQYRCWAIHRSVRFVLLTDRCETMVFVIALLCIISVSLLCHFVVLMLSVCCCGQIAQAHSWLVARQALDLLFTLAISG